MSLKKNILIVGSSSFIAKNLIANKEFLYSDFHFITQNKKCKNEKNVFYGSITNKLFLKKVFANYKPDIIICFSAFTSRSNDFGEITNAIKINTLGIANLCEAIIVNCKVEKIIFFGTLDEYSGSKVKITNNSKLAANSPYGISKYFANELIKYYHSNYNLPSIIIKPSIVYGPLQKPNMFISSAINSLLTKKEFNMSTGLQYRNFLYVDDLIKLIAKVLKSKNKFILGKSYIAASSNSVQLKSVAELIGSKLNSLELINFGKLPLRKNEKLSISICSKETEVEFNWKATTPIEKGILKTINFYLKHQNSIPN